METTWSLKELYESFESEDFLNEIPLMTSSSAMKRMHNLYLI